MLRLIGRLGPRFSRPGRKRGSVVVGAAPGDHHGVPVALAADLLRAEGFTVVDLGADTPAESFAEAARDAERLVAVGINATTPRNEANIAATIADVRRMLGCPIVLGGSGLDPESAPTLGADVVTRSAPEAIAAFNALAETRSRRRA
nr:cobalamin-dependent protein [Rhabdothermincola salaria]